MFFLLGFQKRKNIGKTYGSKKDIQHAFPGSVSDSLPSNVGHLRLEVASKRILPTGREKW